MHFIKPESRHQLTFMQSLDDLVPLDHYVRLIDALVEAVISANPEDFAYKGQTKTGRRAYSPATMLKLLLYGYLNSIKTSRKLERECYRNIEVTPEKTLTDRGYYNLKQMETVETNHKTTCYIPIRKHKDDNRPTTFIYDKENDQYLCSQGKRLKLKQKNRINKGQHFDSYQGIECDGCPVRAQCTTSKYGRIFNRFHNQIWRETYRRRMEGVLAKKIIHLRKQMVEHPFGTIRSWMGKIPLLLRGKKGVSTEINIYSTVYNLRRLLSIESYDNILDMIQDYNWKLA